MPCRCDNIPYALARPVGGSRSAMGAPSLATRIRPVNLQDAKATKECPPPPAFTVAAIRFRKHRGGESLLLKHAYPSGFCPAKPSEKCLSPTENRRPPGPWIPPVPFYGGVPSIPVPFNGGRHGDLLYETEGFGVPPWGAADKRRVVRITRVVVGADAVADPAGSELVQFGPGFPCSQPEHVQPTARLLPWARGSTPSTPVCATINDCAVDKGGVFADRKELEEPWSSRAGSAGEARPQDRGRNGPDGRKIIIGDRPVTTHRTTDRSSQSSRAGPEAGPLPRPTEITERLPSDLCAARRTRDPDGSGRAEGIDGSIRRTESVHGEAGGPCVDGTETANLMVAREHDGDDDGRVLFVKEDAGASGVSIPPEEDHAKPTAQADVADEGRGQSAGEPPRLSIQVDSVKMTGSNISEDDTSIDGADGRGEGRHHLLDDRCARVGQALASSEGDSSVWNDESACSMLSVTTLDKVSCSSSLSGGSKEQLASKRSFSSHETERYGGNLSKDATDILRSHLESGSKLSDDNVSSMVDTVADTPVLDSGDVMQGETAALISPVPPPTPSDQLLDSLLAALPTPSASLPASPAKSARFSLPPVGQVRECYVRTRSEIVFAVVSKKELLDCRGDVDLQTLKAGARSVRIKTGMTLKEGMRAILTSEAPQDGSDGHRDSERGRQFIGGRPRGEDGQARALEYFNSPAGTWEAVRSEHDWKLLLAAPSGPQGEGLTLHPTTEDNGPEADFLVAIDSPSVIPSAPLGARAKGVNHLHAIIPRKVSRSLPSCPSKENNSKETNSGWRYATVVTPGVLGSTRRGDDPHSSLVGDNADSADLTTTPGERGGGSERSRPTPSKTCLTTMGRVGEDKQSSATVNGTVHGMVHGTVGERRHTFLGYDEVLLAATSLQTASRPSRLPKKANVRRLVQHLEARLKLKGRSGVVGRGKWLGTP